MLISEGRSKLVVTLGHLFAQFHLADGFLCFFGEKSLAGRLSQLVPVSVLKYAAPVHIRDEQTLAVNYRRARVLVDTRRSDGFSVVFLYKRHHEILRTLARLFGLFALFMLFL